MRLTQSRLNWNTSSYLRSQSRPMVGALIPLALAFFPPSNSRAEQSANAQSPLGINLEAVSVFYAEQPFLNMFKNVAPGNSGSTGWSTTTNIYAATPEAAYLRLDANGYPTTLTAS